jgi:hypothetical protein
MATTDLSHFPQIENVSCQKCGNMIVVHDLQSCKYIACKTCSTYLQCINQKDFKISRPLKKTAAAPVLGIGTTGILHDVEFKVIAYLEKKERNSNYTWREYLLYNYQKGYATLSEFDGHWSIIKGDNFHPSIKEAKDYHQRINYENIDFRLFNKYTPTVTAAIGEFNYDILNDRIKVIEFIAPPLMIIKETAGPKTDYFLAESIEEEAIASAFNIDKTLFPEKVGIGAIQPSKFIEKWNSLFTVTAIALILVLLLHILIGQLKPEEVLIDDFFPIAHEIVNDTGVIKPFITPSFKIDDASSNIEFKIYADVVNNWFEATIVLVNESDNRTWEVSKGMEYYAGYEDGENWAEGSQTANIMLSNIPKGKYHLNVYPLSGDNSQSGLNIRATANASMWRNTLIICLFLCIYPAYCWFRMRNFEKKRWDNSDYSPYVN